MVATATNDRICTSSSGSAAGAAKALEATPASDTAEANNDMHLAELVRTLRALAGESPERQAHIESIARAYALGRYQVDAQATASGIIRDAQSNR